MSWTPSNKSGLFAWYEFNDLATIFQGLGLGTPVATNNDPIGSVGDKSASGNYLTADDNSLRSLYKTGALNSFPAAVFDNVDDWLRTNPVVSVPAAYSVYFVIKTNSNARTTVQKYLDWSTYFGDASPGFRVQTDGAGNIRIFGWSLPVSNNTVYRIALRFTNTGGAGVAKLTVNGIEKADLAGSGYGSGNTLYLRFLGGTHGEFFIYNSALSGSDHTSALAYLDDRWVPPTPPATSLKIAAINRHRIKTFGDSSLKLYEITPEDGETQIGEDLAADWMGHRTLDTSSQIANRDSGAWQFQLVAATDWGTSQADFLKAVALTINGERWKITKVEKPVGVLPVWKVRAQIQ